MYETILKELNIEHTKLWFKSVIIACILGGVLSLINAFFLYFDSISLFIFLSKMMENIFQIYIFIAPMIILVKSAKFIFKYIIMNEKIIGGKLGYLFFVLIEIIIIVCISYMLLVYLLMLLT